MHAAAAAAAGEGIENLQLLFADTGMGQPAFMHGGNLMMLMLELVMRCLRLAFWSSRIRALEPGKGVVHIPGP